MDQITVRVPATTANCGPGFDAVGIACSMYNEISLSIHSSGGNIIEVNGLGKGHILCDERNIAFQAVKMVFDKFKKPVQDIRLSLTNRIPIARGLGSSAAAIVGGLVAANEITGRTLTKQDLLDMATAMEGHPDNVAPAILGGICVSVMQNRTTHTLTFAPTENLHLVVAVPEFTLSTRVARQVLPKSVLLKDAVFNVSRAALLVGALARGELSYLAYALDDKLHQPYRQKLIPGMEEAFAAAKKQGALGVTISGAGPALMAYTMENIDAVGQAMVDAFAGKGKPAAYHILQVDMEGAKVVHKS